MYQLHYFPGNANLAPHMVLEELGAKHDLVYVDRNANAHKSAEYLKLNPTGRIPVLVDSELDLVLFEAAAICLHLADRHPDSHLVPPLGTAARARFYKWLMYLTNTVQAELMTYFYPDRLTGDEAPPEVVKRHAEQRVDGMLDILDAELERSGGPWLLGSAYTAVDPYLFMVSRWTRGMKRPARALPQLGRYLGAMAARPAVQRAMTRENLPQPWY